MALGASGGSVMWLILKKGLMRVGIGLVIGLLGALAGTRLLATLLFGVEPYDPITLAGVTVLLLAVAALACYGPARRATSVDPLTALRSE